MDAKEIALQLTIAGIEKGLLHGDVSGGHKPSSEENATAIAEAYKMIHAKINDMVMG